MAEKRAHHGLLLRDVPTSPARAPGSWASSRARREPVAYSGFERRGASSDVVPTDPAAFTAVAKRNKWKVEGPKRVFPVERHDRTRRLRRRPRRLAGAKVPT